MPVPNPRKGESRQDFISRFMTAEKDSSMTREQKLAVAYKKWEERNKKREE